MAASVKSWCNRLLSARLSARVWLALTLVALMSVVDIIGYDLEYSRSWIVIAGVIGFAALKGGILSLSLWLTRRWRVARVAVWIFIAGFALLSIVNAVSYMLYDFGISTKLLAIIYETNPSEVRQFMPGLFDNLLTTMRTWRFWLTVGAIVGAFYFVGRIRRRVFNAVALSLALLGGVYFVWFVTTSRRARTSHIIYARTAKYCRNMVSDMQNMRRQLAMRRPLPDRETAASERWAEKVVLVIGESASRDHHSVYGYPLPTTPFAQSGRDSLYVFDNALASSTATSESVPRMITFIPDGPYDGAWYEYPTLLSLFKAYGYSTYWLSNQERTGDFSNLSGILSYDASEVRYVGSYDSEDNLTNWYDDVLLPELRGRLRNDSTAQLFCLHLMGSHVDYRQRYPRRRARFTAEDVMRDTPSRPWLTESKASTVAHYDNSIAFTDSVLSEIVGTLRDLPRPAAMIYVADHGEDVYDDRDFIGRDPGYAYVPFYIYVNSAYLAAHPEMGERLRASVNTPFSTANLIHPLITLTGSRYSRYDASLDFLSPSFQARPRYVGDKIHD